MTEILSGPGSTIATSTRSIKNSSIELVLTGSKHLLT